ncbi:hypothetical protein [Acaryochloris sp. 'Moss Beach']|uniref:hypothetical protein n=1 Tax=Acaryochloris sp. 'Moss Beach' TaxID=2740837 RepID=UPI001F3064F3|nr:hypothetical protein [Acaryochloris sp. 'Moss Beach']
MFNPEALPYLGINEVMEYLYFFDNASLTIQVIEYLQQCRGLSLDVVTVIYLSGGWLMRIKFKERLDPKTAMNLRAVMDEFGYTCMPSPAMMAALKSLMDGQTPAAVMQRYRIAVVTHGQPSREEIEAFQQQFILRSGTYPKSLR